MWNTLRQNVKENIKDFFKVNVTAAGALGTSEMGGMDWIGMSEVVQAMGTAGIVVIIFVYNAAKAVQLYRQMTWEREDRDHDHKPAKH